MPLVCDVLQLGSKSSLDPVLLFLSPQLQKHFVFSCILINYFHFKSLLTRLDQYSCNNSLFLYYKFYLTLFDCDQLVLDFDHEVAFDLFLVF